MLTRRSYNCRAKLRSCIRQLAENPEESSDLIAEVVVVAEVLADNFPPAKFKPAKYTYIHILLKETAILNSAA